LTDSQLAALRLELAQEQAAHAEAEGSRARLASILSEIDAIVWEADALRDRFTFVSQQAESMLGYELSLARRGRLLASARRPGGQPAGRCGASSRCCAA
jgi:PAS domain-containing protein